MSQLKEIQSYSTYKNTVINESAEFKAVINGIHVIMQENVGFTSTKVAEERVASLVFESVLKEQKKYLAGSSLFNGASKLCMTKEVAERYAENFHSIDKTISKSNSTAPSLIDWLKHTDEKIRQAWEFNSPLEISDDTLIEILPLYEALAGEIIEKNFSEMEISHKRAKEVISISMMAMGPKLFSESKRKQMSQAPKLTSQLKIGMDVIRTFLTKELVEYHQMILDTSSDIENGSGRMALSRAERSYLVHGLAGISRKSYWNPVWYDFTDNYYKDLHQESNITDLYLSLQAEDIATGSINNLGWTSCHGNGGGGSAFNLATNRVTFVVYARSEKSPTMDELSLEHFPVDNKRMRFYVHLYEDSFNKVWFSIEHAYPSTAYTWAHKAILGLLHEIYPDLQTIDTMSALVFGGTPEENYDVTGIYTSGYYDYCNDLEGALTYYNFDLFYTPEYYEDGMQFLLGEGLFNAEYDIMLDQSFPTLSEGTPLSEVVTRTGSVSAMAENWIVVNNQRP